LDVTNEIFEAHLRNSVGIPGGRLFQRPERGEQEVLAALPTPVDRGAGDACAFGDVIDGRAFRAAFEEKLERRTKNDLIDRRIARPAGKAGPSRCVRHR
jgi:hypothetical protein